MSVSVTFNGTIIEDEGDRLAAEAGAEDNNVSSLPLAIDAELSTAITADGVGTPTVNATYFPTFAEKDGIVSITGATGTASAFFSDSNGALLNGTDSGLTTDNGTKIYLYTSPSDGRVVYGIAQSSPGSITSGSLVFTIVLQGTFDASGNLTGNFFIKQYQPIENPLTGQVDDNDIVHLTSGSLFVSATQ